MVVGLSGGVDSSVAAYLLKQQGYEVTAVFMINWHDKTGVLKGDCPWDEDVVIAEMVAKKIGIRFHIIDLSDQYKARVIDYMFKEYKRGRTPNPDILCNREIKFDEFIHASLKFEPEFIATGHYCQKDVIEIKENRIYRLLRGNDPYKEQSYFLCQLSQLQLSKALFPIGHLHKAEVREIARKAKLPSAERKDSQGICFIGKISLPTFLQQQLKVREGEIIEIPKNFTGNGNAIFRESDIKQLSRQWIYKKNDGVLAGKHQGAHFFTIGQRKGLNIGGKAEPVFVLSTDIQNNIIYVGQGQDHPGLYRRGLFIPEPDIHWLRSDLKMMPGEQRSYQVRIRYRQPLQRADLYMREDGMYIIFGKHQRSITPGQFAAWYDKDELLGSGVID